MTLANSGSGNSGGGNSGDRSSTARILIRNILSNWMGFAVHALVAFFLTPFVLHALGEGRYGIWALVTGLTGYYGLLDMGLRSGLTRSYTRCLGVGDYERLNRVASSGFVALGACSLLLLIASCVLAAVAPTIFRLQAHLHEELRWAILIIGGSTALHFLLFPYAAVFSATQRYDVANAIGITFRLLSAGGVCWALSRDYGLVGLSGVTAVCNLIEYGVRWRVACRLLPQLRITPGLASWETCWDFSQFGLWSVAINGSQRLIAYSDAVLIAFFYPPAAVGLFNLGASVAGQFQQLFNPIATVFYPTLAQMDARGEQESIRRVYLAGSRLLVLLAVTLGLIAAFWTNDFFGLWLGRKYAVAAGWESPPQIFRILLLATFLSISQRIGVQVLFATEHLRTLSILLLSEAGLNLILSLALLPTMGIAGAAVGTLVPALIFEGFVKPWIVGQVLAISFGRYLHEVWLRPIAVGLILCPAFSALHFVCPGRNWGEILLAGAAGVIIALPVLVALGLTANDRLRLLSQLASAGRFRHLTDWVLVVVEKKTAAGHRAE